LAKYLEYLSAHWADIAGSILAPITRPLTFTGKKARRLLVRAEETAVPPWGAVTYSPRARPRFPIVAPVTWKDVENGIRPDAFNMKSPFRNRNGAF
jgi:hypothetical protein